MRARACLLAVLALALGPGCDDLPGIRFLTPLPGSSVTWMPVDLTLDFVQAGQNATLVVKLNGHDVSGQFTFAAPSGGRVVASAAHVWGGFVVPGANTLFASVQGGSSGWSIETTFQALGDPYPDAVAAFVPGSGAGYGQSSLPGVALGPPSGTGLFTGSLAVVSLGLGGRIDLAFTNNVIVNGPGADFTVFENSFLRINSGFVTGVPFAEPGRVSVSQDGVTWYAFPCTLTVAAGPYWPGCAGVYPVFADGANPNAPHASIPTTVPIASLVGQDAFTLTPPPGAGGDSFDLATVGLSWARYVRIEAATFVSGGPVGPDNAGFDLDGAAAVHSAPATDANGNGIPDAVE